MVSETLSIRIRRDIKRRMRDLRDVDWRREIEGFIEMKIREKELLRALSMIDGALSGVEASKEAAWQTVREFREKR
ncbi:MAG: hypothetical protein QW797_02745 [Thermoproteota archaeon]